MNVAIRSAQEPAPSEGRGALDKLPDLAAEGATVGRLAHLPPAAGTGRVVVASNEMPAHPESWVSSRPADHN